MILVNRRRGWISLISISLSLSFFVQQAAASQQLIYGNLIERELLASEAHVHKIHLTAEPALDLVVDQQDGDGNRELVPQEQARELITRGDRAVATGDYASALASFGRAKDVAENLGDEAGLAEALGKLGNVLRLQGNYAEALKHLQRSIALSEARGDKKTLANALNTAGIIYQGQGEMSRALEHYHRSLLLSEEVKDKAEVARSLNNLGAYYRTQSDLAQALEYYQKALVINEGLGNKNTIAMLLGNIGNVRLAQGDYSESFEFFRRSLKLREELKDERGLANMLTFLGINYRALGDEVQALEHFERSLTLQERLKNRYGVALALEYIGISLLNWKNDQAGAATYFQRSLELYEALKDKHGTARLFIWLGRVHHAQGDYAQSLVFYQKGLAIYLETGDKSGTIDVLISISNAYRAQGDAQTALADAKRASVLARQINVQRFIADARVAEGKAYQLLHRTGEAREAYADAIAAVEFSRSRIAGNTTRASYFTTVREPYELYVNVLMKMHKENPSAGNDHLALQMNERARARSLLEALSESREDIRNGVDAELLERDRKVRQQLNAVGERQTRLLSADHTVEQAAKVEKEIAALMTEFQDIQVQMVRRSPRYAALTQPVSLSVREIQTKILDADTMLLEYALGEERSYLWALTSTSLKSYELPRRAEIEKHVRQLVALLANGTRWTRSKEIDSEYAAAAAAVSKTLLPESLMSQITTKRLIVVGDGALQYLPFGALPIPQKRGSQVMSPLISQYEIVSLPSASTLAVLRRETADRPRVVNSVAVLADPVFEVSDERIKSPAGRPRPSKDLPQSTRSIDNNHDRLDSSRATLERAFSVDAHRASDGTVRETLRLGRLPFTRFEAEGILAAAPANQSLKATDFRANRETATGGELASYRYVHFATHGILNAEHPELSGIVLSLVDEHGKPVDGFLRLHDIYNLNLPADLVVLSACQTGLGKEIRGEGLVGLTRGFMYAGAPRVVASLWKVDDAATAELMKRFYTAMLKDNLRPAAALRRAKMEMWKQKRWQAPFYWAAFELQGEWR